MFLHRILGHFHPLGSFALRAALELAQLERPPAFLRHEVQDLQQPVQLLASADTALGATLLVGDVERIDVRQSLDRHDPRAPERFADQMANGDEEVSAWAGDTVDLRGPQPRVSLLDHFIEIAAAQAPHTVGEPTSHGAFMRKDFPCKPAYSLSAVHRGIATELQCGVKPQPFPASGAQLPVMRLVTLPLGSRNSTLG